MILRDIYHSLNDNLLAYGDSAAWKNQLGVYLAGNGLLPAQLDADGIPLRNGLGQAIQISTDPNQIFRPYGYMQQDYISIVLIMLLSGDFDLTSQIDKHLIEIGGGIESHIYRGFFVFPSGLAMQADSLTLAQKFAELTPTVYGFDVTGQTKTNNSELEPVLKTKETTY